MVYVYDFFLVVIDYQYGVRLVGGVNNKVLITLNARNDHDRQKFVDDLREAILEVNEVFNDTVINV
jgi:IQ motif/SEC7 domain-containing protein